MMLKCANSDESYSAVSHRFASVEDDVFIIQSVTQAYLKKKKKK